MVVVIVGVAVIVALILGGVLVSQKKMVLSLGVGLLVGIGRVIVTTKSNISNIW